MVGGDRVVRNDIHGDGLDGLHVSKCGPLTSLLNDAVGHVESFGDCGSPYWGVGECTTSDLARRCVIQYGKLNSGSALNRVDRWQRRNENLLVKRDGVWPRIGITTGAVVENSSDKLIGTSGAVDDKLLDERSYLSIDWVRYCIELEAKTV